MWEKEIWLILLKYLSDNVIGYEFPKNKILTNVFEFLRCIEKVHTRECAIVGLPLSWMADGVAKQPVLSCYVNNTVFPKFSHSKNNRFLNKWIMLGILTVHSITLNLRFGYAIVFVCGYCDHSFVTTSELQWIKPFETKISIKNPCALLKCQKCWIKWIYLIINRHFNNVRYSDVLQ